MNQHLVSDTLAGPSQRSQWLQAPNDKGVWAPKRESPRNPMVDGPQPSPHITVQPHVWGPHSAPNTGPSGPWTTGGGSQGRCTVNHEILVINTQCFGDLL